MDINRISLYLAGKLPPYYQAPFDKLELIELVRANSVAGYSDDLFKVIDSQDFYSICLNRVNRADPDNLNALIETLNIPLDARGITKKESIKDILQKLKSEMIELELLTAKSEVQNRGFKFEKWLYKLFDLYNLKPKASYKTSLDQIDGSFELDGREYLIEAKWTTNPSATDVTDRLFGRLDRCLIGTVGVIISKNGFKENMIEASTRHKNILLLNGHNLDSVLNGEIGLDDLIRKIRRHMADEGKPFLL